METITHILASFDIFEVLISAFPRIFIPVFHALQGMFTMLVDIAGRQFATHPGIISGTIVFLLGYLAWSGLSKLKQAIAVDRKPAAKP